LAWLKIYCEKNLNHSKKYIFLEILSDKIKIIQNVILQQFKNRFGGTLLKFKNLQLVRPCLVTDSISMTTYHAPWQTIDS
jgi:hypothetical protein